MLVVCPRQKERQHFTTRIKWNEQFATTLQLPNVAVKDFWADSQRSVELGVDLRFVAPER